MQHEEIIDNSQYDFKLDNAALIFPPQHHRQQTTMFRVSANIDTPVNIKLLEEALEAMLKRCPYYRVSLRRGIFWYYLEPSNTKARIEAESKYPCLYIPYKKKGMLPFRVLAYHNRIAFEVAHFITDGTGAIRFLNGLILEYLRRRGETIDAQGLVIECSDPVDPGEYEDSFWKYYKKGAPQAKQVSKALQLKGKKEKFPIFHVYQGTVKSAALKEEAKKHDATIGEFLAGLLIYEIQEEMKDRKLKPHPIRVSIPMNLRQIFPSKTMRNFALTIEPEIDPRLGDFTLGDVIRKVHLFMKMEFDPRLIRKQFARNIEGQNNLILRIVPRIFKDPMMRYLYNYYGRKAFTTTFSNMGRITLPPDMVPFVKDYQFVPPPHKQSSFVTALAYNGNTNILFGSTVKETSWERRVFRALRKMGIPVSVKTNTTNQAPEARR